MAQIAWTRSLLREQSAATSSALIDYFRDSDSFGKLSSFEQTSTIQRDNEDGEKLQLGIDLAKNRGVIDPNFVPEPYLQIDVLGKSPEQVADQILQTVEETTQKEGGASSSAAGFVIVLCGLSGTGKVGAIQSPVEAKAILDWNTSRLTGESFFVSYCRAPPCPFFVKRWSKSKAKQW